MATLKAAFDELSRTGRWQARGVPLRVERTDGSIVEGEFASVHESALRVFVVETQTSVSIEADVVARLWVRELVAKRRNIYLVVMLLAGVGVVAVAASLPWKPLLAGVLLGTAVMLTLLVASFFPPLYGWLVEWRLRYPG